MMDAKRIEQYIAGMRQQLDEAKRQVAMLEGALQFAQQLMDDIDGEAEPEPAPEQND